MKKTILSILTLSIFNVISIILNNPASALTYQDNVGINFTFDTSLSVSLSSASGGSSADLVINNLTPGTSSDSNVIDVNVISNNLSGYVLNSTVGNSTHTNPSYDTRNLVHGNTSSNAVFASLDYGSSIASLNSSDYDNQWGYTYSTDNSTWSNYSGLPKYDDTVNITTLRTATGPSASTGDDTYFKIAAKASPTQASGTYSNVINFTVVGTANPVSFYDAFKEAQAIDPTITTLNGYYKMQDMTPAICNAIEQEESQMSLIDVRDHNIYTVAKLKDNRCWMTTNLNLEGGTEIEYTLSDVPEGYTLPVDNGFQEGNRLPESSTEGFSDNTTAYLYNSRRNNLEDCSSAPGCYSYYSWTTATAGSGISISVDDTDAPYSICPKKWHIPTTRGGTNSTADFRALAIALGGSSELQEYTVNTTPTGNTMASLLRANPYNFASTGVYDNTGYQPGYAGFGFYWSATASDGSYPKYAQVNTTNNVYFAMVRSGKAGFALRCIANN